MEYECWRKLIYGCIWTAYFYQLSLMIFHMNNGLLHFMLWISEHYYISQHMVLLYFSVILSLGRMCLGVLYIAVFQILCSFVFKYKFMLTEDFQVSALSLPLSQKGRERNYFLQGFFQFGPPWSHLASSTCSFPINPAKSLIHCTCMSVFSLNKIRVHTAV